tara:strand:- start:1366 stop:1716 length:351 start_codon:yes stop_codon:yes gene_type:complete
MYSLEITENSITLPNNKTGIIIRDIDFQQSDDITYLTEKQPDLNIQNIKWTTSILYSWDITTKKNYNVVIYKLTDNAVLMKPTQKYLCAHFEHIFGFDFECKDFSSEKTIYLYTRS